MLHKVQSRFRSNHCTQDVLLKTVEDWRSSLERNEIVGSVFIDLSKAFDSINHCLLLQTLALYGFWVSVVFGSPIKTMPGKTSELKVSGAVRRKAHSLTYGF